MNRFGCTAAFSIIVSGLLIACAGDVADQPRTSGPEASETSTHATPSAASPDEFGEPLLAWAEADPEEGKAPLRVQFNAELEGGTPPFTIRWTFGDGPAPSTDRSTAHTYATPGTYRAELAVKDSGGAPSSRVN